MMRNICGIDYAPLVLWNMDLNRSITLSGNANDHRTFGAFSSLLIMNIQSSKDRLPIQTSTNGARSLALGNARGIDKRVQTSTKGASLLALGIARG